jgi:hypothetical protein
MKTRILLLLMLAPMVALAQLSFPYSENFNAGAPGNWTSQGPSWAPSWTVAGGNARISITSGTITDVRYLSPAVRSNSVPDPVVQYRMKIAPSDINCTPELSLYYSTDGGSTLTLLTNIGTSDNCGSSNVVVNANQWYAFYTPLPSLSSVQIAFEGTYPNNGYGTVFLDDVLFRDLNAVGAPEPTLVDLDVAPNPATDFVRISGSTESIDSYSLINMLGMEVQAGDVPRDGIIGISTLVPGCYLLSIVDAEHRPLCIRRVLKQ